MCFLLDGICISLHPIILVINLVFNDVIYICFFVSFYSIAFIANPLNVLCVSLCVRVCICACVCLRSNQSVRKKPHYISETHSVYP